MNIFSCVFLGTDSKSGKPLVGHPSYGSGALSQLDSSASSIVIREKRKVWEATGQLTHSDAAFLASCILGHNVQGEIVRKELSRRFGFLVVDELQDTGFFLGKCTYSLLGESEVRGLLVGDPDQAIYEFTGARPELFDKFIELKGAWKLPLPTTRRCCPKVTSAATYLNVTGGDFKPHNECQGTAFMLIYADLVPDVERLVSHLKHRGVRDVRVVARGHETVNQLQRRSTKGGAKSLHSPSLKHMHQAVIDLLQGKNSAALGSSRAALELALFDAEGLSEEELSAKGVAGERWKALSASAVVQAARLDTSGTLLEWQERVAECLITLFREASLLPQNNSVRKRLRPQARKNNSHDSLALDCLPNTDGQALLSAQTVHTVKGETHDATVFVCKGPSKGVSCPSDLWWPDGHDDSEERRIAYVAITRTKGDLFLCVSQKCFDNLKEKRKEFVAAFEAMSITDFVTTIPAASSAQMDKLDDGA